MNLTRTRVVIRARAVPEVFDLSFRFVIALEPRLFLGLWLLLALPGLAACLWLRSLESSWAVVWLLALAWFSLVQAFFTRACSKLLFSERLGVRDALGGAAKTLGKNSLVCLAAALALGPSLLIPPLLPFALVRFLYLPEIVLLEGFGLLSGLDRARRFNAGRALTALGVSLLLAALALGFAIVSELTGHALIVELLGFPAPSESLFEGGGSPLALLGFFASLPFVTAARFLFYVDGRTRREAWDVQVRFARLAAAKGSGP